MPVSIAIMMRMFQCLNRREQGSNEVPVPEGMTLGEVSMPQSA